MSEIYISRDSITLIVRKGNKYIRLQLLPQSNMLLAEPPVHTQS